MTIAPDRVGAQKLHSGAAKRGRNDGTSLETHYGDRIDWRRTAGIGDAGARRPGVAHGSGAIPLADELHGPASGADALGGGDADSGGYLVGIARGANGASAQGITGALARKPL